MYSKEHIKYLKKRRTKKIIITLFQILIIVLFIIIWQLLADFKIINTFLSSSPKGIIQTLINLYKTNNLFNHIYITIYETFISLLIGTIMGLIISSILWWNDYIAKSRSRTNYHNHSRRQSKIHNYNGFTNIGHYNNNKYVSKFHSNR